jgi:hypothetical protein
MDKKNVFKSLKKDLIYHGEKEGIADKLECHHLDRNNPLCRSCSAVINPLQE